MTPLPEDPTEPTLSGTSAEVMAERDFLLERLRDSDYTWVGMSSDSLVISAITGAAVRYTPSDWPDYWRCENTYRRAPAHLAARMLDTLAEFRALVAAKYPEEWDRPDWAVAPTVCDACDLDMEDAHHDCGKRGCAMCGAHPDDPCDCFDPQVGP